MKNLLKALLELKDLFFENLNFDEIFFVCGQEALPLALKPDEELVYLNMLGTDQEEEAKTKLIEHNIRLVVYIAKKFEDTGYEADDLVSVGAIGLIKAINSFDNSKNIKLATYASRCIENEILMHLRKNNRHKLSISLDDPLNIDFDGNEISLGDILTSEKDEIFENLGMESDRDIIRDALVSLTPREQEIMQLRFGLNGHEEKTQKEIADLLGISQSYISRLEKKIFARLKKEVQKLG